jgi:hypothetical protein
MNVALPLTVFCFSYSNQQVCCFHLPVLLAHNRASEAVHIAAEQGWHIVVFSDVIR